MKINLSTMVFVGPLRMPLASMFVLVGEFFF